jgi:SAM-dependent methyltransferase
LLPEGGTLVDFGAGEGTFLHRIGQSRPDSRLIAIEPWQTIAFPEIEKVTDIKHISAASVDLVGAFEVLEHLTDEQMHEFLAGARAILKPGGRLLVTVPVMYGLALPLKELTRALLHRRLSDTGPVEMAKATVGRPIARAPNRLGSHKGFDFRWLRQKLAADFRIIEEFYSPFAKAPWWTNSQAVFIAE